MARLLQLGVQPDHLLDIQHRVPGRVPPHTDHALPGLVFLQRLPPIRGPRLGLVRPAPSPPPEAHGRRLRLRVVRLGHGAGAHVRDRRRRRRRGRQAERHANRRRVRHRRHRRRRHQSQVVGGVAPPVPAQLVRGKGDRRGRRRARRHLTAHRRRRPRHGRRAGRPVAVRRRVSRLNDARARRSRPSSSYPATVGIRCARITGPVRKRRHGWPVGTGQAHPLPRAENLRARQISYVSPRPLTAANP